MGVAYDETPWQEVEANFGKWSGTIFFRKWNAKQRRLVLEHKADPTDLAIAVLVWLARNERGERLWPRSADKDMIETQFDVDELDRVAGHILSRMAGEPGN